MDAIIYTRDSKEFELLKAALEKEINQIDVEEAVLNGHKRYDHGYDIVVVALEGAEGMEVVLEYTERFVDTNIIWITSDPFFAGTAIRRHIYDFIKRPYDEERVRKSIEEVIPLCPNRNRWHFDGKRDS